MESKFIVKSCVLAALLLSSLSAFAAKKNIKQIDFQTVTATQPTDETWRIEPPYSGWGFGQWSDDHRIQKIIVHVNRYQSNSENVSAMVHFECNGTNYSINNGETVICERSLDKYAGM